MNGSREMFRWSCLGVVVVSIAFFGWAINDLRLQIKSATRQLNEDLPRILENTKKSTEALAVLAQDLKNIRNLAVGGGKTKDKSITTYGNDLLTFIGKQDARIGKERLIGKKLKNPEPAEEWIVGRRREAFLQTLLRVHSKRELAERLCQTVTGPWYIQFDGGEPVKLLEWLKQNHPETTALFANDHGCGCISADDCARSA